MNYDMKYLSIPLPEDITKLKWSGFFKELQAAIQEYLQKENLPESLRKRLEIESELASRIPIQYPFSWNDALCLLKDNIQNFKEEELICLWRSNTADWVFIEGKIFFHELFFENLLKTQNEFKARAKQQDTMPSSNVQLLTDNISAMRQRGNRHLHMRIKTTLRLDEKTAEAYKGRSLQVYMPLPVEYSQVENLKLLNFSHTPVSIADKHYPQRTVLFEGAFNGTESWSTEYELDNLTPYHNFRPENVSNIQPKFYTQEELPHIRFTPYIKDLTEQVVGSETNPLIKTRNIYNYITKNIMYSFVRTYATIYDLAEFPAVNLKGDCGLQALLFITMCRYAGIPARWQSGLYSTPYDVSQHDWAQYYIAPFGWLFADCSFGGSAYRQNDLKRHEFYFQNVDPYRVPYASEFMHEFNIIPNAVRDDPYDNQLGEIICEGKSLKCYSDFYTTFELLDIHEITE